MVRLTFKWNFALFSFLSLIIVTDSLPIKNVLHTSKENYELADSKDYEEKLKNATSKETSEEASNVKQIAAAPINTKLKTAETKTHERASVQRSSQLRPGQDVQRYVISLTREGDIIRGRAVLTIVITSDTTRQPIQLHCEGLTVQHVQVGSFSDVNAENADFNILNGVLRISSNLITTVSVVIVEYTVPFRNDGTGIFISNFNDVDYIAMNLHPINGRRVFPCVDEPDDIATISFTFNELDYSNVVTNSQPEDNSETQFKPLQGPVHTWGMVAHNLNNVNLPVTNVLLYVRPGITNQDAPASVAINFLFTNLNLWTEKPYTEIMNEQNGQMHILSLPDTNRDWVALSSVCIWEPYILMEAAHSVRQRTISLTTVAEAMSRQWFGYAIFPQNFRFQWIFKGLAKYAGYELLKIFQSNPEGNDVSLIDINAIFTTEIIQESLLRDAYVISQPLDPRENIFNEDPIRETVNGLINYKAPALMRMLRVVLGDQDQDFVQAGARRLLATNTLQGINALNFYDAINSVWLFEGNEIVDNIGNFMQTWVENTGYPMLHVEIRQGGFLLTQEHFSFTPATRKNFLVPLTYTTGTAADFDNIHPEMMLDITMTLPLQLGEDDYVLFNLQGQGYYRVNYDVALWNRIIDALYDEDRRNAIHPLNRATLIDDSLNLARAGRLDYDIALTVALAMEMETQYPVWKAFVRNMEFIRKHLMLYIDEEGLDDNIYERMIHRTIEAFEDEIGFEPDPNANVPAMLSLTRGLVMDHACRADYDPCVAAAIDWFYDPNDIEVVNPNIPHEIRPAVYCTMVREGDDDVIEALEERLEEEATAYERLVILEAMACSQDEDFIHDLLHQTIADDSPFGLEERSKIFIAVAQASNDNLDLAIRFISQNTPTIRERYGGPDILEELLFVIGSNIVGRGQLDQFTNWVNSVNSDLQNSIDAGRRARDLALETLRWRDNNIEDIYEWIDINDAPTIIVSSLLIFISFCVALLSY